MSLKIDIFIMEYKTTVSLLETDEAFYKKLREYLSARMARAKITLINEFIEKLEELNEINH